MRSIAYQVFRTVVSLRVQGCSWKDIAEMVGVPLHEVEDFPWKYRKTWQRDWSFAVELQRQESLCRATAKIEATLQTTTDPKTVATLTNALARLLKLQEPTAATRATNDEHSSNKGTTSRATTTRGPDDTPSPNSEPTDPATCPPPTPLSERVRVADVAPASDSGGQSFRNPHLVGTNDREHAVTRPSAHPPARRGHDDRSPPTARTNDPLTTMSL